MYTYEEGMLKISIPTREPAALHELLLKGLSSSFRNYTDSSKRREIEQHAMLDLLEALLPDEEALSKASAPCS